MLSIRAAAERLAVSPGTIRSLIRRGHLAASRVGRVIRIRPEDLDRYLAGHAVEPLTNAPTKVARSSDWRARWAAITKPKRKRPAVEAERSR